MSRSTRSGRAGRNQPPRRRAGTTFPRTRAAICRASRSCSRRHSASSPLAPVAGRRSIFARLRCRAYERIPPLEPHSLPPSRKGRGRCSGGVSYRVAGCFDLALRSGRISDCRATGRCPVCDVHCDAVHIPMWHTMTVARVTLAYLRSLHSMLATGIHLSDIRASARATSTGTLPFCARLCRIGDQWTCLPRGVRPIVSI